MTKKRVIIVGAGIAGLTAARALSQDGHSVTVVDKGRSVGGRMATRRIGDAVVDHGAQFFTVRSDDFGQLVNEWTSAGVAQEWCRGFATNDGHPRYIGARGMNSVAKYMATGLDVRCNTMVFSLTHRSAGWKVQIDDATELTCDVLISTCPLPQSYSLLFTAGVDLPETLRGTDYDRTIALLLTYAGTHSIAAPGGMQNPDDTFQFVADNMAKGISASPALTLHANPEFSRTNWDLSLEQQHEMLVTAGAPYLDGLSIIESQVKKWRFATPKILWPEYFWSTDDGSLLLAGDAFKGAKVEGAALSGLHAARFVMAD
ncbi:MAG: FAD-dependent oxidoreductase [Ilumatobacteraceae bacterium]|nr:FAD-dependent oxidoreductase [Ilumatobacteraceae bacterium]